MIRRILHAELSDVRALARDVKRRVSKAIEANVYLDLDIRRVGGCFMIGPGSRGVAGVGFVTYNHDPALWPDGARLLTIGRVTLAAWGGRPS